jgi:hypothetical protein
MDSEELFEDEVEEVVDDESAGGNNILEADDTSDEDMDMEDDENSEGSQPIKDDSSYVFSLHKGSITVISFNIISNHRNVKVVMLFFDHLVI